MTAGACPPAEVRMIKAATAAYPASANLTDGDLVVRVDVSVRADGTVSGVRVTRSSGKADADASALAAAKASRYRAAARNCAPVAGHYAYTATFVAPVEKSSELPPGH